MRPTRLLPCALVLLASLPACFDTSPQRFASLAEMNAYQKKEGFVLVEHFGSAWPAVVVSERQFHDSVNVVLANSEAYRFDDFEGYKLRVIKLKGQHSAEIVAVYRSEEKA